MYQDRYVQPPGVSPELRDLDAAVDVLWTSAGQAAPDQYPGFEVTHDGKRAQFKMCHSSTVYDQVALFRDSDGIWCIEEQIQRPSLETEGLGQLVRTTTTHTLALGRHSTRIVEMSGPHTRGEFTPQSLGRLERGFDVSDSLRLLNTLRVIRGERPERKMRNGWNWLRWLGVGRT